MSDPEFIKILQTLPSSCEVCICYKKTEPKPIVGNFNMVSVTNGSKSGISKKSLYKPAPKEKIKAKRTNRKPLAQGQLVDLNNPRSAKIYKNGMKSLLIGTLERNLLSSDVQRRETICTPRKASLSCRLSDAISTESCQGTLVPSLTPKAKQQQFPSTNELFLPLRTTTDDIFQSPHQTINLDLSDAEVNDKLSETMNEKENQNKVEVFYG